jgi:hypothetical protein
MTVYHNVDRRKALVDFTVNVSLKISRLYILILNLLGRIHLVLNEVILRAHECRRHIARHPERSGVVRASNRDVPVRVEDAMMVEDVAGSDQTTEEVFKADLFALGEISGRHSEFGCLVRTWLHAS